MFRELGHPELTVEAFHFLTSGGALSKSGRGIDVAEQRRLTELIPLAGVLGGACKNNIIPGKLHMGIWLPLCKETRSFLPDAIQDMPECALSMYDLMDEQSYSRMDDTKDVRKHRYLPEPQRELLMAPKTKTAKDGTEIAEKPGVAQQMRYSQEVMVAGTTFYVWMQLNDVTESFSVALHPCPTSMLLLLSYMAWHKNPNARKQHQDMCAFACGVPMRSERLLTMGK